MAAVGGGAGLACCATGWVRRRGVEGPDDGVIDDTDEIAENEERESAREAGRALLCGVTRLLPCTKASVGAQLGRGTARAAGPAGAEAGKKDECCRLGAR